MQKGMLAGRQKIGLLGRDPVLFIISPGKINLLSILLLFVFSMKIKDFVQVRQSLQEHMQRETWHRKKIGQEISEKPMPAIVY